LLKFILLASGVWGVDRNLKTVICESSLSAYQLDGTAKKEVTNDDGNPPSSQPPYWFLCCHQSAKRRLDTVSFKRQTHDMILTSQKEELGILLFSASACLTANQQNKLKSHLITSRIHRLQPKTKEDNLSTF